MLKILKNVFKSYIEEEYFLICKVNIGETFAIEEYLVISLVIYLSSSVVEVIQVYKEFAHHSRDVHYLGQS
jgi:hypothetical protein